MSNDDSTGQKQELLPHREKGKSGNPKGRPKGSRNKLSEAFISDLHADWMQHGVEVIKEVREEKPGVYLKLVASILPKDLKVNINKYEDQSDAELGERIRELDSATRPYIEDRFCSSVQYTKRHSIELARTISSTRFGKLVFSAIFSFSSKSFQGTPFIFGGT